MFANQSNNETSENIIRLLAMASIAVFFSFSAIGQEKSDPGSLAVGITQPNEAELKFMAFVGNPNKQKVQLKNTNVNYGTIDRTVFRTNQYGMICNLTDAADGVYTIEARSGKEVIRKTIAINIISVYHTNRMVSLVSNTR